MCVVAFSPSRRPALWQKNRSRRSAQTRGSSSRTLPAVDVAGIGERAARPLACLLLVQPHQIGIGHVDFAADFQQRRHIASPCEPQRNVAASVRTLWVISSPTRPLPRVTPRDQQPVLVDQRDGHAIDLQLDHPLDRLARQQLGDALAVLLQLLDAVGVVDREHRHAMLDLAEPFDRLVADPLRGAVGRDQIGMLGLQLLEPLDQAGHTRGSLISGAAST